MSPKWKSALYVTVVLLCSVICALLLYRLGLGL